MGHVKLYVSAPGNKMGSGRVVGQAYGGQVVAQALSSAVKTVEDPNFLIRSVHCYFNSAVKREDVIYHVVRLKDGRSISTKEVRTTQGGNTVFSCLVLLSAEEKDIRLTDTDCVMPQVEPPSSSVKI